MIIEFFGLPGAGKTALSTRVARNLRLAGYYCNEPKRRISEYSAPVRIPRKAMYGLYRASVQPRTAVADSLAVHRTDQPFKDRLKSLFNWHYSCGIPLRNTSEIQILDEGIYQALWSIGLTAMDDWETVLNRITPPNHAIPSIVIVVTASDDVIADRIADRTGGDSRYNGTSTMQRYRAREGFNRVRSLAKSHCENSSHRVLIEIENARGSDLNDTATVLSEQIRQHL